MRLKRFNIKSAVLLALNSTWLNMVAEIIILFLVAHFILELVFMVLIMAWVMDIHPFSMGIFLLCEKV